MLRTRLLFLSTSVLLHLLVALPRLVAWREAHPELEIDFASEVDLDLSEPDDEEGELPIEPLLAEAFHVSLYEEAPPPPPVEAVAAVAAQPEPVVSLPLPVPVALPAPAEEVVAVAEPEPPPKVEEPLPEPVLTDEDRAALAAMEQGEATADTPEDDDDGEALERARLSDREKRLQARADRRERLRERRMRTTTAKREPCPEPTYRIARVAESAWYIDRDLIEYYATHIVELQKLGSVWTHRTPTGELDGFRVALARCSVLREGGLRSGDIVQDINGRRIHSVFQAIGAYIALRAEPNLTVNVMRKGQPVALAYTVEQPERLRDRRRAAKEAKRKAAAIQAQR